MADRHGAPSPSVSSSTPSWMTNQRRQRQRNRGYGRRTSTGGGSTVRNTPMNRRDSTMALFGSAAAAAPTNRYEPSASLDFDAEEDGNGDNVLDKPMHLRVSRLNRSNSLTDDLEIEAREEVERSRSHDSSFPAAAMTKTNNRRKKNGPSLPRPPKPTNSAGLRTEYRYQPKQHGMKYTTKNAETSSSSSLSSSSLLLLSTSCVTSLSDFATLELSTTAAADAVVADASATLSSIGPSDFSATAPSSIPSRGL
mmetsp:Transcript_18418/g.36964  ORF Transcript_18418/g.36964 Transcript_18418/m.36964 type:complete len:253 (+) Transcript_18418:593-1351(+)